MSPHEVMWQGLDRRGFLRGTLAVGASVAGLGLLEACGAGSSGGGGAAPVPSAAPGQVPSYYPGSYDSIIAGSKKEKRLTIYSNLDQENFKPLTDAFQARYPWVEQISTNNLGSAEVFQRYYSEQAAGSSPADLLISGSPQDWIHFVQQRKLAMSYPSPELAKLPDIAQPFPGLYTFSADPILMAYNKALLPEGQRPTGLARLAKLAAQHPETFRHKITTYSIDESFGFAINYHYVHETQDAWRKLESLLPNVRPETSSGPMVDKINSGEYVAGYFMSSTVVLPAAEQQSSILGWSYIDDGTPIFLRGMAAAKAAHHPNTAKLMLDFVLSKAGQTAVFNGGLTPYRSDLGSSVTRTYQSIQQKVGKSNVVPVDYSTPLRQGQVQRFKQRWERALGQ